MTYAQIEAKETSLETKKNEMLARYEQVDETERKEIVKHVNSFINSSQGNQKEFWLDFRNQLSN